MCTMYVVYVWICMYVHILSSHREELKKSLEVALGRIGGGPTYTWGTFWGAHQRFFKQLW